MKIATAPQLKKFIPIFIAMIFGAGIIFFSINGWPLFGDKVSSDTKEQNDLWKGSLSIVPQDSATKLLNSKGAGAGATTTTDFLARELFSDFAYAQMDKGNTALSKSELKTLADILSEKISASDVIKQYTEKDFVVVTTSTSTLEIYKKEVAATLNAFAQKKNVDEMYLVNQALYNKDPSKLALLTANISDLQKLVKDLEVLKVPDKVLVFHIPLVQGYANILSGVIDMQQILDDPARGMRGIAKYLNGVELINGVITKLQVS